MLGRPSVLTLYDEAGRPGYALLVGLTPQNASLRIGGVTHTVSLLPLTKLWRGEFATLWRAPPGFQNKPFEQAGPVVDWLALQLAKVHGEAPPASGQKFDAAMQAKVSAFQVAQGLRPDGRPGPITLMQLNRAVGIDEPRLQAELASN
jgi:general secretion pathway protein A